MRRTAVKGGRRGIRTARMVSIARERMEGLLKLAEETSERGRLDMSRRYVDLARRIGMRYNVRLPASSRYRFCPGCNTWYRFGTTASRRLRTSRVVIRCGICQLVTRLPYDRQTQLEEGTTTSARSSEPTLVEGLEDDGELADEEAE